MAAINQSSPQQVATSPAPANSSPVYTTPAHAVGSQFVQQYYTVLHSSPRYLHRFYTDLSTMTHSDGGHDGKPGYGFTVQNQKNIHEKVTELDFEEAVTEIWSVDSQYSSNDGVIVQVTGALQCKGKARRNFVQTFFLAVQEKGYFVLNDIFRYLPPATQNPRVASTPAPLENGFATSTPHQAVNTYSATPAPPPASSSAFPSAQTSAQASALPPAAPSTAPPPAPAPTNPVPSIAQPTTSSPTTIPTPDKVADAQPVAAPAPDPEPEAEEDAEDIPQDGWPAATESEQEPVPESEPEPEAPVQEEEALPPQPAVPLTYAERLMANTNKKLQAPPAASTRPQPAPAPAAAALPSATTPVIPSSPAKPPTPAPAPNSVPTANGNHVTENGYYARDEPPGTSVFVRNLPAEVTAEKLAAAFKEFGPLRGANPVNLKIMKGKESFAFVDFEESSAQQAAIAGPVLVDSHQVVVVEKRPMFIKPRGRGGAMPGGRGSFRGGRGDGRGRGEGGRASGGVPRFLERGASLGSERSDGGRGGGRRGSGRSRGGGRDGAARGTGRSESRPAAPTPVAA